MTTKFQREANKNELDNFIISKGGVALTEGTEEYASWGDYFRMETPVGLLYLKTEVQEEDDRIPTITCRFHDIKRANTFLKESYFSDKWDFDEFTHAALYNKFTKAVDTLMEFEKPLAPEIKKSATAQFIAQKGLEFTHKLSAVSIYDFIREGKLEDVVSALSATPKVAEDLVEILSLALNTACDKPADISVMAEKNDYAWVGQAISKDELRLVLNAAWVTDGKLVATDGHRLHVLKNVDLPEGARYFVKRGKLVEVTDPKLLEESPPPIDHLLSEYGERVTKKNFDLSNFYEDVAPLGSRLRTFENRTLLKKYFEEATCGDRGDTTVTFGLELDPIRFSRNNRVAIVTPMRS